MTKATRKKPEQETQDQADQVQPDAVDQDTGGDESLADIVAEGAQDADQEHPDTPEPAPEKEPAPPTEKTRLEKLQGPCAGSWRAGCWVAAKATDVQEMKAADQEAALAGEHMARILDEVLPEEWLQDWSPDSKVARIITSGAMLVMIVQAKSEVYQEVMDKREQAAKEAAQDEKSESQAA